MDKPFSQACARNRDPILDLLRVHFADRRQVLEIGSGTGQHAVHFAAALPWLTWRCSDRAQNLPGIRQWLDDAGLANTPPPVELDVLAARVVAGGTGALRPGQAAVSAAARDTREVQQSQAVTGAAATTLAVTFDAVFSANTLHIMAWPEVEAFFDVAGAMSGTAGPPGHARAGDGVLVVYGPFNYGGEYTSASNRDFDGWLKARDPQSGIRDFEAVDALARGIGLHLVADSAMPANNRCLVWRTAAPMS